MKNFLCKILSLLIVACFSVNLVACKSSSTDKNKTSSSSSNEAEPISISLSITNLELSKGDTYQLYVTISPSKADQTVVYSSVNENCATINSQGLITAIDKGNTVIRAETVSGLIATCNVEVSFATGSVEGSVTWSYLLGNTYYMDVGAVIQLIPTNIKSFPTKYTYLSGSSDYEEYGIYTTTANSLGTYKIENIPVGQYRIIVRSANAKMPSATILQRLNDLDSFIESLYGEYIGEYVKKSIDRTDTVYLAYHCLQTEITIKENQTTVESMSMVEWN